MKRLVLLLIPLEVTTSPLTVTDVGLMLKAVMFCAAFIKTVPISLEFGTAEELNANFMVLMIDPFLNFITVKLLKEAKADR